MSVHAFRMMAAAAAAAFAMGAAAPVLAQDVGFNVGVTSDYIFRGLTQTDKDPAIQGGVDFSTDSGWYGGAWASNVDFGDDTDAEVDVYGGYTTEAGGFAWDFGALVYTYVGAPGGVSYDNVELKVAASRAIGPASVGAAVYYSPESWGVDNESVYYELNAGYALTDRISLSGAVGRQTFDPGVDYTTWNVGGAYALTDKVALDLRYHDTDLDGYDEAFVASLKLAF